MDKDRSEDSEETAETALLGDDISGKDDVKAAGDGPVVVDADIETADDIIQQLGGCGRFQVLMSVVIQAMKLVVCWGMVGNSFFAFVPNWRCADDNFEMGQNASVLVNSSSTSITVPVNTTSTAKDDYWNEMCTNRAGKKCQTFEFEKGIDTVVTEFNLVCDLSWVTATMTSLQMVGMCVGSVLSGHLADMFGRKKPFFMSMVLLFVFHAISYFATHWLVFAIARFFIGLGSSFFLSIYCTLQGEYALSKWRAVMIGFPSWAIEASILALVAWILHDWKGLTLVISLLSFGYLFAWFFVPESFRWYIAVDRDEEAKAIVKRVARWNKQPMPNFERLRKVVSAQQDQVTSTKYTALQLFRRLALLKLTIPLLICWFTMGLVAYGINFGIKKLSGNIFLNLFLFSIVALPAKLIAIYLQNRFGRKVTAYIAFSFCLFGGLSVGIVQYIDTPYRDVITNYCALAASMGVDGAWGPLQTLTVELYPTVIRNLSFGTLSTFARFGAVVGPQFVFLGDMVPGILYMMVAATSILSLISVACLPETMNVTLVDKIVDDLEQCRRKEKGT